MRPHVKFFGVVMKDFKVSLAVCLLPISMFSFAQIQPSSTDKSVTSEKSQAKRGATSTDAKAKGW